MGLVLAYIKKTHIGFLVRKRKYFFREKWKKFRFFRIHLFNKKKENTSMCYSKTLEKHCINAKDRLHHCSSFVSFRFVTGVFCARGRQREGKRERESEIRKIRVRLFFFPRSLLSYFAQALNDGCEDICCSMVCCAILCWAGLGWAVLWRGDSKMVLRTRKVFYGNLKKIQSARSHGSCIFFVLSTDVFIADSSSLESPH